MYDSGSCNCADEWRITNNKRSGHISNRASRTDTAHSAHKIQSNAACHRINARQSNANKTSPNKQCNKLESTQNTTHNNEHCPVRIHTSHRGACRKNFRVYLGFCPNWLSFFHEKVSFFGWKGLGLRNPTPHCDKISTKSQCGFGFKKLGLGQTPPLVATKSQVNPKKNSAGSPTNYYLYCRWNIAHWVFWTAQ